MEIIKLKKEKLKEILYKEKIEHLSDSIERQFLLFICRDNLWFRWLYLKYMRYEQYYRSKKGFLAKALLLYSKQRKNILGRKLGGYEMRGDNIGEGLRLYHNGNIIIHDSAIIGENCKIHGGSVCIGNNGYNDICPKIGNNVDIGISVKIIGDCKIANNIIIGAGSVVVSSFEEEGIIIAGVPARKLTSSRKIH